MNYLELYNDVLLVVLEERPTNADRLFKAMNNRPVILNAFEKGDDGKHLAQFTLETLDDLIENNLIKGNVHSTKDGNVYTIERLTTAGHLYLIESTVARLWRSEERRGARRWPLCRRQWRVFRFTNL